MRIGSQCLEPFDLNLQAPADQAVLGELRAQGVDLGPAMGLPILLKDIVDAKGDLIAATAADTVARLAVGADDTILMADAAEAAREALIEMVAEADEALMEKFFEAGTLTQEELSKGLAAATRSATILG